MDLNSAHKQNIIGGSSHFYRWIVLTKYWITENIKLMFRNELMNL